MGQPNPCRTQRTYLLVWLTEWGEKTQIANQVLQCAKAVHNGTSNARMTNLRKCCWQKVAAHLAILTQTFMKESSIRRTRWRCIGRMGYITVHITYKKGKHNLNIWKVEVSLVFFLIWQIASLQEFSTFQQREKLVFDRTCNTCSFPFFLSFFNC